VCHWQHVMAYCGRILRLRYIPRIQRSVALNVGSTKRFVGSIYLIKFSAIFQFYFHIFVLRVFWGATPHICKLHILSVRIRIVLWTKSFCVFHKNHCNTQLWARVTHLLQCVGRLSLPPSEVRLRNDLYCVGWGVKLYSLTQLHPQRDGK